MSIVQAEMLPTRVPEGWASLAQSDRRGISVSIVRRESQPIEISAHAGGSVKLAETLNQEEKTFNCLVALKVGYSHFAMHLDSTEKDRLFSELDYLLEEWDPNDKMVNPISFAQFLKWLIYSNEKRWSSLGVSNDGNILAAWVFGNEILTGEFYAEAKVAWAWKKGQKDDLQFASGQSSLIRFAQLTEFYLGETSKS